MKEQTIEFKIGKQGTKYEITIKYDAEGKINDVILTGYMKLTNLDKLNTLDIETYIAKTFIEDAYVMYDLQEVFRNADINEEFTFYFNAQDFIDNHVFKDEELKFIYENTVTGNLEIHFTVTDEE